MSHEQRQVALLQPQPEFVGAILAGGRGTRMKQYFKPTALLAGKSLVAHVSMRLSPQVKQVVLSANDAHPSFSALSLPIIGDENYRDNGPLAGILAALKYARAHHENAFWLLSVPADCPFIPLDLGSRLYACSDREIPRYALCRSQPHFLCALWPSSVLSSIESALNQHSFSVRAALAQKQALAYEFPEDMEHAFFNVNDDQDLQHAERILAQNI